MCRCQSSLPSFSLSRSLFRRSLAVRSISSYYYARSTWRRRGFVVSPSRSHRSRAVFLSLAPSRASPCPPSLLPLFSSFTASPAPRDASVIIGGGGGGADGPAAFIEPISFFVARSFPLILASRARSRSSLVLLHLPPPSRGPLTRRPLRELVAASGDPVIPLSLFPTTLFLLPPPSVVHYLRIWSVPTSRRGPRDATQFV